MMMMMTRCDGVAQKDRDYKLSVDLSDSLIHTHGRELMTNRKLLSC